MIVTETTLQNVVVLRLVGTLTGDDIATMKKVLFGRFEGGNSIGLVVDVSEWSDITAKAIAADAKFEWEMLGKLKQIPRVAFVTDKQWYQAMIGLLKPLLASTEVKVFSPDAIEQATAFAADFKPQAIAELSRPSMEQIPTDRDDLIAFEYRGHIESQDLNVVLGPMKAAMDRNRKIDLFVRLNHFTGFDPTIIVQGSLLSLKMAAIRQVRRYAIVGASGWMKKIIHVFDPLLGIEMRTFEVDQEAEAWDWLNEPKSK